MAKTKSGFLSGLGDAFGALGIVEILKNILTSKETLEMVKKGLAKPPRPLLMEVIRDMYKHLMIPNNLADRARDNLYSYMQMAKTGQLREFGYFGSEDELVKIMCSLLYLDNRDGEGIYTDNHWRAMFALYVLGSEDPSGFCAQIQLLEDEGVFGWFKHQCKSIGIRIKDMLKKIYDYDAKTPETSKDLVTWVKQNIDKLRTSLEETAEENYIETKLDDHLTKRKARLVELNNKN